ncbi:MAG: hypothetical protein CMM77_08910 [Rhodospirillaceae bacterium]|nr:hypothetical protein [Magnetovibrio sp.]MAY67233.1 hypothetical protein [Rhodospirillaceae bacterium]
MSILKSMKTRLINQPRFQNLVANRRSPAFNTLFQKKPADYYGYDLAANANAKAIVIGLPKAGNNWLLGLLSDCLDLDVLPDVTTPGSGVCMTNQPFSSDIYFQKNLRYAVYIMRDLRDVVCSYYHFIAKPGILAGRHRQAQFTRIEDFYFEYFLGHLSALHDFPGHAAGYLRFDIPLVRYESLWDDTAGELSRLLSRWGLDVPPEAVQMAVDANAFDKLKKSGKDNKGHKLPASHMRKGGYGNFRKELPEHVIADIERRFGDYLLRWGYTLTTR